MQAGSRLLTRRRLLAAAAGGGLVAIVSPAVRAACLVTPPQAEGPFYPTELGPDTDWDLTHVEGVSGRADGEVIEVAGRLFDTECRPVSGGRVEIWQTDVAGRYHYPHAGGGGGKADPAFQGFGRTTTDTGGNYRFRTVKPAHYSVGGSLVRTPHIHFKAYAPDGTRLTTQMYFANEPMNEQDFLFTRVPEGQRDRVLVDLGAETADNIPRAAFDIALG